MKILDACLLVSMFIIVCGPTYANPTFKSVDSIPDGWQFVYLDNAAPRIIFVQKCTKDKQEYCRWSRTSAREMVEKSFQIKHIPISKGKIKK